MLSSDQVSQYAQLADILVASVSGGLGGLCNYLISRQQPAEPISTRPSCIISTVLGVVAAIVVWGLGAGDLPIKRTISLCILSGLGGGNFLVSMLQQVNMSIQTRQNVKEVTLGRADALRWLSDLYANLHEQAGDTDKPKGADTAAVGEEVSREPHIGAEGNGGMAMKREPETTTPSSKGAN